MKEYVCNSWSEVPEYLKTKTSLNQMGIYTLCKVSAIAHIYNHSYNLYNINLCLELEQNKGNKTLVINSLTKDHYLIMEMKTTGKGNNDEITELVIINFDGKILFYKNFSIYKWEEEWNKIQKICKDKILLVPNTIYAKRLIIQTCNIHHVKIENDIYAICSKHHIQHKISLLNILGKSKEKITDPKSDCFEFLNILYPRSEIYKLRIKARTYFDKLCEYRVKQGDMDGREAGQNWMMKEYGLNTDELDFNTLSYEICEDMIELIYPLLKGLGILPKRID